MPDVTLPPVLIDVGAEQSAQFTFRNPYYQGPFLVGTDLYVVLRTTLGSPKHINVFKSTDAGLTWAQQDSGNSPVIVDSGGFCRYQVRLNPNGTTFTIAYNAILVGNGANTVKWVTFDTTTDLFGAGVADLTAGGVGNSSGLEGDYDFVIRANGDILIAYGLIVAPNVNQPSMGFQVYSGGMWGTWTEIAPGDDGTDDAYSAPALCLDATGVTHVFTLFVFVIPGPASRSGVAYQQISALDVATAPALLTPVVGNYNPAYGRPCVFGTSICLPVYDTGAGGTFQAQAIMGTPLAAPVFTIELLDSGGCQVFDNEGMQFTIDDGDLWALWIYWPDATAIEIRRAINTGSGWGTVGVYYDLLANPPNALPAADQAIFGFTCASVASVGAVFTDNDPGNVSFEAYYIAGAAAPPVGEIPTGQLVFYGVRRRKHAISAPGPSNYDYYEKPFIYPCEFTLTEQGNAAGIRGPTLQFTVEVTDFDFELRRIEIGSADDAAEIAVTLYNKDWQAVSNLPVIGTYLFHISDSATQGMNSWPSPPLLYPLNTVIRFDVTSMIPAAVTVPKTYNVAFVGVRRIPRRCN